MREKTTIVIPNYNGMQYLEKCLQALHKKGNNAHILVVDNGSADDSKRYVKDNFPEVELLEFAENKGFCMAVNAGIKAARTPYVLLLNNDTEVKEEFVSNLEAALERSEKIFSVASKMLVMQQPEIIDGAGDLYCALGWAFARKKGKKSASSMKARKVFAACGGASIYRKAVFDEIGLFDNHHFAYLEDMDIGYRAQIYGYENWYEPKAEVLHAGSGFSGSRYNEFKTKLSSRNSIYIIAKNMPLVQKIINLPFLLPGFLIKILFFIRKGMGHTYIKGLLNGITFSMSREGRKQRVPFQAEHVGNYCRIQLQLWINIIKRVIE